MSLPTRTALAAIAALALSLSPARAEILNLAANLTGSAEVPPTDSAGVGKLSATIDTDNKLLTWTITYEGLSGPATAAHFHAPAATGANAGPVVAIPDDSLESPVAGEANLTDEQITELKDGKWYFNIHTAKFPDGEVRGQLEPSSM